ncbi:hypothetical protein L1D14_09195 [Vibrio tubiashii]|uniref:hypothetical protein n=1 Tax=Vibrio tubiashii TaxID=29498 RepID=UPI001EFC76EE|nr:hypothetical protein [Vibrio tubiashii]MCG9576413.1 hypothetical protein [Vibrio tubiashii]
MLKLQQTSTWRGLALLGGAVAAATGNADLLSVSATGEGVQLGGLVGMVVTGGVGLYDAFRDEVKGAKKLLGF